MCEINTLKDPNTNSTAAGSGGTASTPQAVVVQQHQLHR